MSTEELNNKRTTAAPESDSPAKKVKVDSSSSADDLKIEQITSATGERVLDFPVHHVEKFLDGKEDVTAHEAECKLIAQCLKQYGLLVVRDPRVSETDNDNFLNMMEEYFEQPREERLKDIRPELHYQVGATPNDTEHARPHCDKFDKLLDDDKPLTLCPPEVDPKWRFFWRVGPRPETTQFAQLNAPQVLPAKFPQWKEQMDLWGGKLIATVQTVAKMAAHGMGLKPDAFTSLMQNGPHLLAPTGSDLYKHGKGTVFANFHYDLNFMTIHGRSRFPGLFVWTREGKKVMVKVPPGCLLLQAGKQFEWLTGGEVLAGFHEVVVCDATVAAVEKAKAAGKSRWRISSTLFSHIASDNTLQPLDVFANAERLEKYPPTLAGQQVQNELEMIKLGKRAEPQNTESTETTA
jgi:isopenicillin N synthase-like dioxygenase